MFFVVIVVAFCWSSSSSAVLLVVNVTFLLCCAFIVLNYACRCHRYCLFAVLYRFLLCFSLSSSLSLFAEPVFSFPVFVVVNVAVSLLAFIVCYYTSRCHRRCLFLLSLYPFPSCFTLSSSPMLSLYSSPRCLSLSLSLLLFSSGWAFIILPYV